MTTKSNPTLEQKDRKAEIVLMQGVIRQIRTNLVQLIRKSNQMKAALIKSVY